MGLQDVSRRSFAHHPYFLGDAARVTDRVTCAAALGPANPDVDFLSSPCLQKLRSHGPHEGHVRVSVGAVAMRSLLGS